MATYLGIDTSNYTTSVAIYDTETNKITQCRKLLNVKNGTLGLKQSDAVFAHVKQLGNLIEELFSHPHVPISAVGVSVRPRDVEGSYMPCFLVGELTAASISAAQGVPRYNFSHQAGHMMAALYSADTLCLMEREFIAFHLSGGTTECLRVKSHPDFVFEATLIAHSLDLKAGQAVDRVGGMLSLPFPAGMALETLAMQSEKRYKIKPTFKGYDCCLSGVENKCAAMLAAGEQACDVAAYCIQYLLAVVDKMTADCKERFPDLPVVYAGGVMSNSIIREQIGRKYGGSFAQPVFSSDNAAGTAILASVRDAKEKCGGDYGRT